MDKKGKAFCILQVTNQYFLVISVAVGSVNFTYHFNN